MKEDAPLVFIGSDSRRYFVTFGDIEVALRIPEMASGRAPVLGALEKLKAMPATLAVFERAPLRLFLNRAKLLDTGMAQWRPVILTADIEEKTVAFRHASTLGDIQDRMAADFTGVPLPKAPIGFGLKSMADVCDHVRTEQVTMALRGQLQPAVITEEVGGTVVTHILLPVRPHSVQASPESAGEQAAPPAPPPIVSADDF